MLIGGVGGICRTGKASVTGYKEFYLQGVVSVGSKSVDELFVNNEPIIYSATVRIQNELGNWVEVADVAHFQCQENREGSNVANLTVRNTDKWSISGTENPDLLAPSFRPFQIYVKMKSGAKEFNVPIFIGQVTSISEAHGQRNGALSVVARSVATVIQIIEPQNLDRATCYRLSNDECQASGLLEVEQVLLMLYPDNVITSTLTFESLIAVLESVAQNLVAVSTNANGYIVVSQKGSQAEEYAEFTISDKNDTSITRSIGSKAAFNTIDAVGRVLDALVVQRVQDTADVAKRGVLSYGRYVGGSLVQLADAVAEAENLIAEGLRGKVSVQCRLNPFLRAGVVLNFDSQKLFITGGKIRIGRVTHDFRHGYCYTQISDGAVLT